MAEWYAYRWFIPSIHTKFLQSRHWPIQEDELVKYLISEKPHDLTDVERVLDLLAPSGYDILSYFAGIWGTKTLGERVERHYVDDDWPGIIVVFVDPAEATYCKNNWESMYLLPRKLKTK